MAQIKGPATAFPKIIYGTAWSGSVVGFLAWLAKLTPQRHQEGKDLVV